MNSVAPPVCRAPQAAAWLLGVPGASATVLEVAVPYCRDSLVELLGEVRVPRGCVCIGERYVPGVLGAL